MRAIDTLNVLSLIVGLVVIFITGGIWLVLWSVVLLAMLIAVHEAGHYVVAKYYKVCDKLIIAPLKGRFAVKIRANARIDETMIILAAGPLITLLFATLLSKGITGDLNFGMALLVALTTGALDLLMLGIFIYFLIEKKLTMGMPIARINKLSQNSKFLQSIFTKDERVNRQ